MADITLFWCFWKNKILDRMMEFQVKFCYHSGLRLWRTGMLFSTKFKGHKSKFRISWMYRYHFYDLKVHFWWPNERFFWCRSSSNALYKVYDPVGSSHEGQNWHHLWTFHSLKLIKKESHLADHWSVMITPWLTWNYKALICVYYIQTSDLLTKSILYNLLLCISKNEFAQKCKYHYTLIDQSL